MAGDFFAEFDAWIERVDAATPEAIAHAIHHIAEVSAQQTPLEEGTLVRSQQVKVEGDTASISYGTPYARYQHERLSLRHEHGNAKFLEGPMIAEKDTALDIIANDLSRST
jgi:hypothetical protein